MAGVRASPGRDLVIRTSFSNLAVLWGIFGVVAVGALLYGAIDPARAAVAPFLAGFSVLTGAALTVVIRATTRIELREGLLVVCPVDARGRRAPYVQRKVEDIVSVSVDRFLMQIVDRGMRTTVTQITPFNRADVLGLLDALEQLGISTETTFKRT